LADLQLDQLAGWMREVTMSIFLDWNCIVFYKTVFYARDWHLEMLVTYRLYRKTGCKNSSFLNLFCALEAFC